MSLKNSSDTNGNGIRDLPVSKDTIPQIKNETPASLKSWKKKKCFPARKTEGFYH